MKKKTAFNEKMPQKEKVLKTILHRFPYYLLLAATAGDMKCLNKRL